MPPAQAWPLGHLVPQTPQLLASVPVLISQPSPATLLQSAKPALQTTVQTPAAQVGVVLARLQTLPQPPQLAMSVWVPVSQPSAAIMSQSAKPAAHAMMVHLPATQP